MGAGGHTQRALLRRESILYWDSPQARTRGHHGELLLNRLQVLPRTSGAQRLAASVCAGKESINAAGCTKQLVKLFAATAAWSLPCARETPGKLHESLRCAPLPVAPPPSSPVPATLEIPKQDLRLRHEHQTPARKHPAGRRGGMRGRTQRQVEASRQTQRRRKRRLAPNRVLGDLHRHPVVPAGWARRHKALDQSWRTVWLWHHLLVPHPARSLGRVAEVV